MIISNAKDEQTIAQHIMMKEAELAETDRGIANYTKQLDEMLALYDPDFEFLMFQGLRAQVAVQSERKQQLLDELCHLREEQAAITQNL